MIEKERRPWGYFTVLKRGDNYCVKELFVEPEMRISLQFHRYRTEDWVVVEGDGIVQVKDKEYPAYLRSHWVILPTYKHRATAGPDGLVFIETQTGNCYEEDIVRLDDDYGRLDSSEVSV